MAELIPVEKIASEIYRIRGVNVLLDRDLAEIYGVETKMLKQAVKRNMDRFPADFMFEMTESEFEDWKSQFAASENDKPALKCPPMVFTEQGVAMLSTILGSQCAIQVNIHMMRAFTRLRKMLVRHVDLKRKIHKMEMAYDTDFMIVFEAIKQLLEVEKDIKQKIGFTVEEKASTCQETKPVPVKNSFYLTPQARKIWGAIPGDVRIKLLNNVWCAVCRKATGICEVSGSVKKGILILTGKCTICGGKLTRVVETD